MIEVVCEPVEGSFADWDDAVFVAFAFEDLEDLAFLVEVSYF